jgi:hypothetical protein
MTDTATTSAKITPASATESRVPLDGCAAISRTLAGLLVSVAASPKPESVDGC